MAYIILFAETNSCRSFQMISTNLRAQSSSELSVEGAHSFITPDPTSNFYFFEKVRVSTAPI